MCSKAHSSLVHPVAVLVWLERGVDLWFFSQRVLLSVKFVSRLLRMRVQEAPRKTQEWIESNARGCPVCGVAIQKNGGCDHMNCANCGAKFGWTNLWHGRKAAPRPTAGSATVQSRRRSGPGTDIGGAPTTAVSAEDLARAQDRDTLQRLLSTALGRREHLERQLQTLHGTRDAFPTARRSRAGVRSRLDQEQRAFKAMVLAGLPLFAAWRSKGVPRNIS